MTSTLSSPRYAVTGLKDGRSYLFRVRAVSKYGESEPLETEAAILIKSAFGKDPSSFSFNMYMYIFGYRK